MYVSFGSLTRYFETDYDYGKALCIQADDRYKLMGDSIAMCSSGAHEESPETLTSTVSYGIENTTFTFHLGKGFADSTSSIH